MNEAYMLTKVISLSIFNICVIYAFKTLSILFYSIILTSNDPYIYNKMQIYTYY